VIGAEESCTIGEYTREITAQGNHESIVKGNEGGVNDNCTSQIEISENNSEIFSAPKGVPYIRIIQG